MSKDSWWKQITSRVHKLPYDGKATWQSILQTKALLLTAFFAGENRQTGKKTKQVTLISAVLAAFWWVTDGVRGDLEVSAVAQSLAKPEEREWQGEDFWGTTVLWQTADFHTAAWDANCTPMRLCAKCPFTPSQPVCYCLSPKRQILGLPCQLVSPVPSIHLPNRKSTQEWSRCHTLWWYPSRACELCIPIASVPLMRHCRPAAVLHHPPSASPVLLNWFPTCTSTLEPVLSLSGRTARMAWIRVPGFLSAALK